MACKKRHSDHKDDDSDDDGAPSETDGPPAKKVKYERKNEAPESQSNDQIAHLQHINLALLHMVNNINGIIQIHGQGNTTAEYEEISCDSPQKLIPCKIFQVHWYCPGRGILCLLNPDILRNITPEGIHFSEENVCDKYDTGKLSKACTSLEALAYELAVQQIETNDGVFYPEQVNIFLDTIDTKINPLNGSERLLLHATRPSKVKARNEMAFPRPWFSLLPFLRLTDDKTDDGSWIDFFDSHSHVENSPVKSAAYTVGFSKYCK